METPELKRLFNEVKNEMPEQTDDKFVGAESIITILIFFGLKILLPEIQEWVKLGFAFIPLYRQKLEAKLKQYALEKGLDYKTAEIASAKIAEKINEDNISALINELQSKP